MIDVLMVDDHTIFRSGLQRLLLDEADIRVTGEAGNASEALALLRGGRYDLVLLDINMEGRNGLDLLASLRGLQPTLPVLMLSMYAEEQYALLAIQSGANGYIAKDADPAELVQAIRRGAAGGQYLRARAAPLVRERLAGRDERPAHQRLTVREHQIMMMMLKGTSLTEIGEEMLISVKTVSTHRTHILQKLGVASTAELVLYAVRHHLIQ